MLALVRVRVGVTIMVTVIVIGFGCFDFWHGIFIGVELRISSA